MKYGWWTGSQTSLQSWASSLSYDSQAEDPYEPKEFMRNFVEEVFKTPHIIDIDRKARFGEQAQVSQWRKMKPPHISRVEWEVAS